MGYEFLIYESINLGTWFLEINNNFGTSIHTHFKKNTIMIVVSGKIKLNMVDDYKIYGEGSIIFIPKRKFHGLNSLSNKSYIIEIEIFDNDVNFSDKNDLLRLIDNYKRENTGYSNSVKIKTENIEEYNYFYLKDNLEYQVKDTIINYGELKNIFNKDKINDIYILYENTILINNKIINVGSFFNYDEISKLNINKLNNKFLKLSFNGKLNNKIIILIEELTKIVNSLREQNEKIILTCGCFDILHTGHLKLLEESKKLGGKLFVLISSDEQIKFLKGETRPINNQNDRLEIFKIIPYVDYIIPYNEILINKNEEILDKYINIIKPDIWTKGSDYNIEDIIKLHPSLQKIKLINLLEGKSTTNIINEISNKK
jgi:rfaE bifunctional protein nucleotidyltransferase chain/domain